MFKGSYIKFNNEQLEKVLFENRINNIVGTNKIFKCNKPKVLFRNKTINTIINGNKNRQKGDDNLEAIILTEHFNNSKNKKSKKFNINLNVFREKTTLAFPALCSGKIIKKNNLIKNLRINRIKRANNKKFEIIKKNMNIEDLIKTKLINELMGSCCSVERIENKFSKKNKMLNNNNNNDNRFIKYKNESKKINSKSNNINRFNFNNNYNNDINKNNINDNKYNSYKYYSLHRMPYRIKGKNLVNEETMTYLNNNTNISNDDKNNENNKDNSKDNIFGNTQYENTFNYITSKKSFNNQFNNEPIQIKGMAQLKTLNNFNSKHYKTINI
jgi:hypothetical protein